MPEREPVLPYNTAPLYTWCDSNRVNMRELETLYSNDFVVADLDTDRLSREYAFRQEVEKSLPLEGSKLVEPPDQHPESPRLPMVYMAPDGMAFEITSDEGTFIGKYLGIDVYTRSGEPQARITVRRPEIFAARVFNPGGHMMTGPSEEDMIRLPSKYDPEKDGAAVAFSRFDDWRIIFSREFYPNDDEFSARYGEASVRQVPDLNKSDSELYIADFDWSSSAQKLDDFIYIEEKPMLPPGFSTVPSPGGGYQFMRNAVSRLILPPIDQEAWGDLWDDHGIMIKANPTAIAGRFVTLDYSKGRESVARQVREFNSGLEDGRMFRRLLVVKNTMGRIGLAETVRTTLAK